MSLNNKLENIDKGVIYLWNAGCGVLVVMFHTNASTGWGGLSTKLESAILNSYS